MSRELSISYNGASANLYVVIRSTSNGSVWSVTNSALETFSDVTLATNAYSVVLTDRGGDLYDGDMPSALPAGDYRFFYYERAGANAAVGDLTLKSTLDYWDGAALADVSTVTLSSYALTDLASAKRRLNITDSSSDTLITEYINMVSAEIERVTGVNFRARDYREWKDGNHQREMLLNHYPIQTMTRIAFGSALAMSVTFSSGSGIRANAGVYRSPESPDAGGLRLVSVASNGTETVTSLPFATYKSVTTLVTAINLVSGWSATTLHNQPTSDLHPSGGADALGRAVFFSYPDLSNYDFSVDYATGRVRFDNYGAGRGPFWGGGGPELAMPKGFQHVLVQYRAGWETIPADIQLKANEIVGDKYFEGQTGRGVTEVRLGPYLLKLDQHQIDDLSEVLEDFLDPSRFIGGIG